MSSHVRHRSSGPVLSKNSRPLRAKQKSEITFSPVLESIIFTSCQKFKQMDINVIYNAAVILSVTLQHDSKEDRILIFFS